MSEDVQALCQQEGWSPELIVGHSAGCAIALVMSARMGVPVMGINAALGQFEGLAGILFPAMAKALAALPFTADLFARTSGSRVDALIASTGSTLPDAQMNRYRALVTDRTHVDGALRMMAQWSLDPLWNAAPDIRKAVILLASEGDLTVPPHVSQDAARRFAKGAYTLIPRYGHLVHEEAPEVIAPYIIRALSQDTAGTDRRPPSGSD